jgi:steroid delta-isomerase-like uncharacterized protein
MPDGAGASGARPGDEHLARRPVDILLDQWEAAWSEREEAAFAALCEPDVHYEDPLCSTPLIGVEELAAHAGKLWSGFPDARLERAGERLTDGRYVAAPARLAGTHREAIDGLPATNRSVVIHCLFYCELRRTRLLRVRAFFDLYDAATQLGVLPRHGTLSEKALLTLRGFGFRARGSS